MSHTLGEFLEEVHGIQVSRETIRKLLLISGLRTKSKSPPRHRTRRARMTKSGLLVQMDSSEHKWLGVGSIWFIATIDDATGEVPYAIFVDSDSTENNMRVIKRLIEKKGIPVALYTDPEIGSGLMEQALNLFQGKSFYNTKALFLQGKP